MTVPNISPFERPRQRIKDTLDAHLAFEIGLVNTEAGDSLTVPTPTIETLDAEEEFGEEAHVGILVVGFEPNAAFAPMEYSKGRLTSIVRVDVACLVQKDEEWSEGQFVTVMDRLAACFLRVLTIKYERLLNTDNKIMRCWPVNGGYRLEVDQALDPTGRKLRRVVVGFNVQQQETI
ncbi:MAG: hypothetical protein GY716_10295 [bacterium]|nr:hypothetical protein [bacterium]